MSANSWRRVQIIGTCDPSEVDALREQVICTPDFGNFHCLSYSGGMGSFGMWAKPEFNTAGNLAERGFDADDIAKQLAIIAQSVPSLKVTIHVGEIDESDICVATVKLENGNVVIGLPEVEVVPEQEDGVALSNMQFWMDMQRRRR